MLMVRLCLNYRVVNTYVPGWSAIVTLSYIVITLAVPTQEEDFVVNILSTSLVQGVNVMLKFLPLGERPITLVICRVCAID